MHTSVRRALVPFAGGLCAVIVTALLLTTGAASIRGREAATPDFTLETPDDANSAQDNAAATLDDVPIMAAPDADAVLSAPLSPPASVGPQAATIPDAVSQQALEPVPTPPDRQTVVLRHPMAVSAGRIRFADRFVQLEGILPQEPDKTCAKDGKNWPCGMVARTAFRSFLRARALSCSVTDANWQGTTTGQCSIGDLDVAGWLADNGWAEAEAGSPFTARIAAARQAQLGFFGTDPRQRAMPKAVNEPAGVETDLMPDL